MSFGYRGCMMLFFLSVSVSYAGPWAVNLEDEIQSLPWVITADVLSSNTSGVVAVVDESFRGDFAPGDTVSLQLWDMGTTLASLIRPGEGYLLLPDSTGALQIAGFPGEGYWLLRGSFDFNAFWIDPGVINIDELMDICAGDTLSDRTVEVEIWFAGGSEFTGMVLQEEGDNWISEADLECLDGIRFEDYEFTVGGQDNYPFEPDVYIKLHTEGGGILILHGKIVSFGDGVYSCRVYPTGPIILGLRAMVDYLQSICVPEFPSIDIQLHGIEPGELGLEDVPRFTVGESGMLHLNSIDGSLQISSLVMDDYWSRPSYGFDQPMTCYDPIYFTFDDLPDGPSGHLATDILDALAKGRVTGSVGMDPGEPMGRFELFMLRN